jgi:hypothetical protein
MGSLKIRGQIANSREQIAETRPDSYGLRRVHVTGLVADL